MNDDNNDEEAKPLRRGDLERVFGKINCLGKQANDSIMREIQASLMEQVESPSSSLLLGNHSLNAEAQLGDIQVFDLSGIAMGIPQSLIDIIKEQGMQQG
jgi:hypothetical protein